MGEVGRLFISIRLFISPAITHLSIPGVVWEEGRGGVQWATVLPGADRRGKDTFAFVLPGQDASASLGLLSEDETGSDVQAAY